MKIFIKYNWLQLLLLFLMLLSCKNESWVVTNSRSPKILLFEVCPNPNMVEETEARDLYRYFKENKILFHIVTNDNRWSKQVQLSKRLMEIRVETLNPEIIHLAIHGDSTELVLSKKEGLTIQDMNNMKIWKNKIIVSGACEGGHYAQLLLKKGAKMVVASNKKIPWPNLGKFFTVFYTGYLANKKPELALKEAIKLYPEYESYRIYR